MAIRPEQRPDPSVDPGTEPLAQAHVFLTGVTGFIGQAILEKLLSAYPSTRITVLIRPRKGVSGSDRLTRLMRKPVFRSWRERIGDDEANRRVAERVSVIDGDLDDVPDLPGDLDVVIHGASTVTFDEPIDRAFATNVSGAVSLYDAVRRSGSDPHVVHVSTAYVAGVRKGLVPEESHAHSVDWRAELAAAQSARREVETASRRPEVLRRSMAAARAEHGKAGPQAVAEAAEAARHDWVHTRLVDHGRLRAQSLGWPDVYTFSKALGERVAEDMWARPESGSDHRLSVVRPAIVESALKHPYPGWIDGFKVADPLIVAYGRGLLPEFPGLPDSVLDIVPVDVVVNTTLAVAAKPPSPGEAQYFHVCSGARNPLPFRAMYEMVHEYFTAHPMPDSERGHIRVPKWRFPARSRIERTLRYSEKGIAAAERFLVRLPGTPRTRAWMSLAQRRHQDVEALRGYADLYRAYTGTEIVYDDSRTHALHRQLSSSRVEEHGFDTGGIDWPHYLQDVHFPGVTAQMRSFAARSRSRGSGDTPRTLERRDDVVAVFDLEGTVVAANVVEQYLWVRLASLPRSRWPAEVLELVRAAPEYLRAERRDRGEFVRAFARRYAGVDEAALRELVTDAVGDALLQRVQPEAVRRIREHREAGHRTVLVTGTIDVLVEPLAALVDEVVAARMHSRDGIWTGYLDTPPLVDEARAAWLTRYAADREVDLSGSYAYGDSHADRVWLELVGNPEAVNPDAGLFRHANRKNWPVHSWGRDSGSRFDALVTGVSTPRPSAPAPRTMSARSAADREVSA